MTRDDYEQLEDILIEQVKQGKISETDKDITLTTLQVVYSKCIACTWNDGKPHLICCSCD